MASPAEARIQAPGQESFDPNEPLRIIGYIENNGVMEPVYDTNALRGLAMAYADKLAGIDISGGYSHRYVLSVNGFRSADILNEHRTLHPETSTAVTGFCREYSEARERLRAGEFTMEDYRLVNPDKEQSLEQKALFSQFYVELEPIALRLNPGENPRNLCL